MSAKRCCLLAFLLVGTGVKAQEAQHVMWEKTPIAIALPLNQERLVRFPQAISIIDSELQDEVGVMKLQDALYLNAHEPFANKRLIVQLMPEGEAIVLNLSAQNEAVDVTPIEVLLDAAIEAGARGPEETAAITNPSLNAVSLTRFAIQSLYAPARLLVTPAGVVRTPMLTHRNVALVYGASVLARPLISWQGADLYVTAIELKNQLNKPVIIDPRQLIGDWQTATFYPTNTLNARGKKETTTLFLTSNRPFGEALTANREFVR